MTKPNDREVEELAKILGYYCIECKNGTNACIPCTSKAERILNAGYSKSPKQLEEIDEKEVEKTIKEFHYSDIELEKQPIQDWEFFGLAQAICQRFGHPKAREEVVMDREKLAELLWNLGCDANFQGLDPITMGVCKDIATSICNAVKEGKI